MLSNFWVNVWYYVRIAGTNFIPWNIICFTKWKRMCMGQNSVSLHGSLAVIKFSVIDPLMRWNGWKKCQTCFRALELNATLQNQNPKQKGVKIQGAKSNPGKWWWIRNTLSCGGALSQAPTFTSTEVSPAWLPGYVVYGCLAAQGFCSLDSLIWSVLVVSQKICHGLLFVIFRLPVDESQCLLCCTLL